MEKIGRPKLPERVEGNGLYARQTERMKVLADKLGVSIAYLNRVAVQYWLDALDRQEIESISFQNEQENK